MHFYFSNFHLFKYFIIFLNSLHLNINPLLLFKCSLYRKINIMQMLKIILPITCIEYYSILLKIINKVLYIKNDKNQYRKKIVLEQVSSENQRMGQHSIILINLFVNSEKIVNTQEVIIFLAATILYMIVIYIYTLL